MSRDEGFSLVELVLAMVLVSIIAALAAPRYAVAVSRYRVEAAARRVAADLALAQSDARTASASRTVSFDPSTSTYRLIGRSSLDAPAANYVVSLSSAPYYSTLGTVSFGGAGTTSVTFNGYGVPDNAGTIVVRSGNLTRQISVDADTGNASVR